MAKSATQVLAAPTRAIEWGTQVIIVISARLFVALCARVTSILPTPVPLTLQNFAVLLVDMLLGRKPGFADLALYLAEGAIGLPVFNPLVGVSGVAQIFGITRGDLMDRKSTRLNSSHIP